MFIMLNPSVAGADIDDPTICRCIGFAKRWKCGGLYVGNLFAARATNPNDMLAVRDPVGPENKHHLHRMVRRVNVTGPIVCAWGTKGGYMAQDRTVMAWLQEWGVQPYALGTTYTGYPRHPLYVRAREPLVGYRGRREPI